MSLKYLDFLNNLKKLISLKININDNYNPIFCKILINIIKIFSF